VTVSYIWQPWLADELRAAGLTVHEVTGWKTRGRPASTGAFAPEGVTVHHTGTHTSDASPHPTLTTLIQGRSDLPGPLAQISVDHRGEVWVIAAGRANHAGRIDHGMPGMPQGGDGNAHAFGDEVDTDGRQSLPAAQVHSMAVAHRVLLDHAKRSSTYLHRHADIAPNRKWDIGSRSTPQLRRDVDAAKPGKDWSDMATEKEVQQAVAAGIKAALPAIADAVLDAPVVNENPDGTKATGSLRSMMHNVELSQEEIANRQNAALTRIEALLTTAVKTGK
jgi:hypothetical protein